MKYISQAFYLFLVTSSLFFSHLVYSNNTELSSDNKHQKLYQQYQQHCRVELTSDLTISPTFIDFHHQGKSLYAIEHDKFLLLESNKLSLTAEQNKAVKRYALTIRAMIPEVKAIALETIDMTNNAIGQSLLTLLGPNNQLSGQISQELSVIKANINLQLDENKVIHIDQQGDIVEQILGVNYEQRLASLIENAMSQSIAYITQQVLFSGQGISGGAASIEGKIKQFSQQLKATMQAQQKILTEKGQQLCHQALTLAEMEQALSFSIPQLSGRTALMIKP